MQAITLERNIYSATLQLINPISDVVIDRSIENNSISRLHDHSRHLNHANAHISTCENSLWIWLPVETLLHEGRECNSKLGHRSEVARVRSIDERHQFFADGQSYLVIHLHDRKW